MRDDLKETKRVFINILKISFEKVFFKTLSC
jgi:hypothetical protein